MALGAIDCGVIAYPVAIIETEKGEVLEVGAMKIQFKEDEE